MNERFNQLLKQVEEETNAEYQDESRRKRRLYNEILLPKFAELIVKECILAVKNVGGYNEDYHMNAIKKYFGVEE
jgi:hypothetical protein